MPEASFPGDGRDGEQPPPDVPARDETTGTPANGRPNGAAQPARVPGDVCLGDRAGAPTGLARDDVAGRPEDGRPDDVADAPDGGHAGEGPDDGWLPGMPAMPDDDWDPEAEEARFLADLDAGRARIPEEWEIECRPPVTISLGDAADVDPAELAAMLGPDGLGGEIFAQDRPADALRPGPLLAALTERAAADPARLTDNELLGAMAAARRLAARAEHLELRAIAEFTRRQDARHAAAIAARVPPGRRDGEFADAELGMEIVTSPNAARDRMDFATALQTRLSATGAALAAGLIDGYRASIIWRHTRVLSDADAARADQVLAEVAPHLRYDQLARRAIALAMKLDPEAMKRGKEQARRDGQRVEARREDSGNACLNGRELAVEDVLASKAHIDAAAAALRAGGLPGSRRQLQVLAYLDLTQGRNPLDRLASPASETVPGAHPGCPPVGDQRHGDGAGDGSNGRPGGGNSVGNGDADADETGSSHGRPDDSTDADGNPGSHRPDGDADADKPAGDHQPGDGGRHGHADSDASQAGDGTQNEANASPACSSGRGLDEDPYADDGNYADDGPGGPAAPARGPAPFPALVNLTIPAATLFGWSDAPGDIGGWGLADSTDTRRLAQAAARHPATRWCITITGPDGTAVAHGCARGPHPWIPPPPRPSSGPDGTDPPSSGNGSPDGPTNLDTTTRAGPDPGQAAALEELLRRLNLTLHPIARGTCDHRHREDHYTPSRALKHLVRARTATCPAPGCGAQAYHNDVDHTLAYPAGPTDECNLGPPCRRHHRVKQAPGWHLSQPEPGVMRWTTPSGRVHTTRPTVYHV
jgi:hypothetical protein